MLDYHQKSTGTQNTMTYALLIAGLILSPAIAFTSRSSGYYSVAVMIACSIVCLALARMNRRQNSTLTMIPMAQSLAPSLAIKSVAISGRN